MKDGSEIARATPITATGNNVGEGNHESLTYLRHSSLALSHYYGIED